ncbi:hypothetical protein [Kribbella speibonae]|uniref:Uncharacterized protein n=1 Tax=Kribbella speibonae TaxID=1572660 RepID=A0A4R0ICA0_9ACTN|nr:hypothetical protein [Kribbella speibonae]TCC29490.1 hypothetical protein E0H92_41405 [Kribbella speibonae]
MSDESETDRLINTDVSALSGPEMREHLDAVERRMKELLRAELELLEGSAQVLADRPELQARLDYLRSVDLNNPPSPT